MRIVVDTNVLLVSVSERSASHWFYKAFEKRRFEVAFTTEILAEYEEQFDKHWSPSIADNVVAAIINAPNGIETVVFYNLRLLSADEDDNKFVDCAFAAGADFLVTNDAGFAIINQVDFPKIRVVSLQAFKQILLDRNLLEQ